MTTKLEYWADANGYHIGLSAEQISEGQRRARAWLARHSEAQ